MGAERSSGRDENPSPHRSPAGPASAAPGGAHHPVAGSVGALVITWALLTGLLILAGEGIKKSSLLTSVDRRITTFVVEHRTAPLNELMKTLTWTGSWLVTLGMAVVVAVLAWRRRLPLAAVFVVLAAWFGELVAVTLTKAVVQRPRPPEAVRLVAAHGWAFPSGHTANAVVVFAVGATLVTSYVHRRTVRVTTWVAAGLLIALVAFSRIELGVHWTTDVVASVVWTSCWLLVLIKMVGRTRADVLVTADRITT